MIRSMTGFGEADRATPAGRVVVQVRTVNHRFFHVNIRSPAFLARWEPELREWLRASFARGHVNCTIRVEPGEAESGRPAYRLDDERVAGYLNVFRELGRRFDVPGDPDLHLLARFSDIIVRDEGDEAETEIDADDLRAVVEAASRQAVQMREDEGRRLSDDLEARLVAIGAALDQIGARAPERLTAERDRLRERVRELADGIAVDEERLAREIAILAERWDVNEELVRFRSHIELFRELLGAESEEPVGKRFSFLVQEMHREANTIGSKANDAPIAHDVVAIKDEIERLREQVENIE